MIDKLYMWIAWCLPKRLVDQCCIRARRTRPYAVSGTMDGWHVN